ncbi:RNA polymerase sigma factor (sigma-70 family) [Arthrobacter sp. CAN_A214]|uniref:sigma factor-like helix-turn-helix DNA-binding protein n=1 Tax=Arthrobacter sp. CAN_A214 TaxID=2787720 RepID=UPI0018C9E7B3
MTRVRSEQSRRVRDLTWGIGHQDTTAYGQVCETVIDREEAASLTRCLAILSPVQREAIDLAYYTGLTYVDVAHRLGIPVPTAKTRIRDGIKKLGTCLKN